MPTPHPAQHGVRVTRRAALSALAAASLSPALVACTTEPERRPAASTPPEPEVDSDVVLASEALAQQRAILDLLSATGQRHPDLAWLLEPLVAAHDAHASLLAEAVPDEESEAPSPSATPGRDRRTRVPRSPTRAVDELSRAERTLVTVTKRHAFRARSGAFARVLASMAAAAAQNATVLEAAPPRGKPS